MAQHEASRALPTSAAADERLPRSRSELSLDDLLGQLADGWILQKTLTTRTGELAVYEPAGSAGD